MVGLNDHWDDDLSAREVERLSPKLKAMRSRSSLERKVQCLEKWAGNFNLAKQHEHDIPWKRPALRAWHDSDLKLWKWGFSPVDVPTGTNQDLMDRYLVALASLRTILDSGRDVEVEALRARVEVLEKQNIHLLDQISRLQRLIPNKSSSR